MPEEASGPGSERAEVRVGVPAAFAALLQRPAWFARAACRGSGPAQFFPDADGHPGAAPDGDLAVVWEALERCRSCPVELSCAEAGRFEEHGVWGGRMAPTSRQAAKWDTAVEGQHVGERRDHVDLRTGPCAGALGVGSVQVAGETFWVGQLGERPEI